LTIKQATVLSFILFIMEKKGLFLREIGLKNIISTKEHTNTRLFRLQL